MHSHSHIRILSESTYILPFSSCVLVFGSSCHSLLESASSPTCAGILNLTSQKFVSDKRIKSVGVPMMSAYGEEKQDGVLPDSGG